MQCIILHLQNNPKSLEWGTTNAGLVTSTVTKFSTLKVAAGDNNVLATVNIRFELFALIATTVVLAAVTHVFGVWNVLVLLACWLTLVSDHLANLLLATCFFTLRNTSLHLHDTTQAAWSMLY